MLNRILVIMVLLPGLTRAQTADFTIQGNLGASRAKMVYLYVADIITNTRTNDSAVVSNGKFAFNGSVSSPLKAILFSVPDNNRLDFYVEPGAIRVGSKDSLHNAAAIAGKLNADFIELRKVTDPINLAVSNFARKMRAEESASPAKKTDKAFQDEKERKFKVFIAEKNDALSQFIRNNPGNIASVYAIADLAGNNQDLSFLQPLFQGLDESVRTSALGSVYKNKLDKISMVSVGAPAPEFTQADTAGKPVSLKDFRGKYVLIDFWASWCGPCREENPNLIKAFERYKNDNFTVLGVSLDRAAAKSAWLKAIAKDGLPWTQVSDLKGWDNEVSRMYNVESVPKNFLIDPAGKIVAKDLHGAELNKRLAEILISKN